MSTNHDKIMEKLGDIHTDVAVLKEQQKEVGKLELRTRKVEDKLSLHDKIVGAVCLASGILITLVKYGKL